MQSRSNRPAEQVCPHYGDRPPHSCPYCVADVPSAAPVADDRRQHRPKAVASSARTCDPRHALTEAELASARECLTPAPSTAAFVFIEPGVSRSIAGQVLELLRAADLERWPNDRRIPTGRWWRYANRQRWTPTYKGDLAPANEAPAEPPPVPYDLAWRSTGLW